MLASLAMVCAGLAAVAAAGEERTEALDDVRAALERRSLAASDLPEDARTMLRRLEEEGGDPSRLLLRIEALEIDAALVQRRMARLGEVLFQTPLREGARREAASLLLAIGQALEQARFADGFRLTVVLDDLIHDPIARGPGSGVASSEIVGAHLDALTALGELGLLPTDLPGELAARFAGLSAAVVAGSDQLEGSWETLADEIRSLELTPEHVLHKLAEVNLAVGELGGDAALSRDLLPLLAGASELYSNGDFVGASALLNAAAALLERRR